VVLFSVLASVCWRAGEVRALADLIRLGDPALELVVELVEGGHPEVVYEQSLGVRRGSPDLYAIGGVDPTRDRATRAAPLLQLGTSNANSEAPPAYADPNSTTAARTTRRW
jgi:hypothetical protein